MTAPASADRCAACWTCLEAAGTPVRFMLLCPVCGNKRCPHANDHTLPCTASNDVGQAGSAYEHGPWPASARRAASAGLRLR